MPEFTSPFTASAPPKSTPDDHIVARAVRFQIAAELEAVNQYDEILLATTNPIAKEVVRSILLEEKKHLGELLALLYILSPIDRSLAADGESEVADIQVRKMRGDSPLSNS